MVNLVSLLKGHEKSKQCCFPVSRYGYNCPASVT